MAAVHRLLCTHCTFGSSELEHSTAENAAKVLGYSVRRSSLPEPDRGPLRTAFRGVERLLSYDVPKDTPPAKKESLEAATAPRRLVFLPNLGGWQAAAHVAYRTRDTHGRIGSYFADVLAVRLERDTRPWSPLDVLQLWSASHDGSAQAPWWCDSEELLAERDGDGRWKPADAASPSELRGSDEPLIRDELLRQFLTLEPGEAVDDPGRIVSPRWWQMPASQRRDLLAALLQATIQARKNGGKENAVVAAEPSVAALLFYGVFRLLPSKLRDGIGFSTYEAAPERPLTPLVGTTFLDGEASASDLPPELSGRGFACNTFRDPGKFGRTTPPAADGFVYRAIELVTRDGGWEQLDGVLDAIDALPRPDFRNLDELARIDAFITRYVSGSDKLDKLEPEPPASPGSDGEKYRRIRFNQLVEQRARNHGGDWPRDLLRSCIRWVGDDFGGIWQSGGPIADTLRSQMPDDDNGLAKVLDALKGIRHVPPDFVAQAVVRVALTTSPSAFPPSFAKFIGGEQGKDNPRGGRLRVDATALVQAAIERLATENRQDVLTTIDKAFVEPTLDAVVAWEKSRPGRWIELRLPLLPLVERELTANRTSPLDRAEFLTRYDVLARALAQAGTTPVLSQAIDDFFRVILQFVPLRPTPLLPGQGLSADGQSRTTALDRWLSLAGPQPEPHFRQRLAAWTEIHETIGRLREPAQDARRNAKCPFSLPRFAQAYGLLMQVNPTAGKTATQKMTVFLSKSLDGMKIDAESTARATIVRWLVASLPDDLAGEPSFRPTPTPPDHASDDLARYFPPQAKDDRRGGGHSLWTRLWKYAALGASVVLVTGAVAGVAAWLYQRPQKEAAGVQPEKSVAGPAASPKSQAAPAQPETAKEPGATADKHPLTSDSLEFTASPNEGKIKVKWNKDAVEGTTLELHIDAPGSDEKRTERISIKEPAAGYETWDPKDHGFGDYVVRLIAKNKDSSTVKSDKATVSFPAPAAPKVDNVQFTVTKDGRPSLSFRVTEPNKADLSKYGSCKAELSIPQVEPRQTTDFSESLTFTLPAESLTPSHMLTGTSPLAFYITSPLGSSAKCFIPLPKPGDVKADLIARLRQKASHDLLACPLSEEFKPGTTTQLLELPWWFVDAGMQDFDLHLLPSGHTTTSAPPDTIQLNAVSPDAKHPTKRWECRTTAAQVGFFEIYRSAPWKSELRFKANDNPESSPKAYAKLCTFKICFSVKGEPFCTAQLIAPLAMGQIVLALPETLPDKMPSLAAKTTLPPQWVNLNLYPRLDFEKHTLGKERGEITISREEPEQKHVAVLAASKSDNAIRASLHLTPTPNKKDLLLKVHNWEWTHRSPDGKRKDREHYKKGDIDRMFLDALHRKQTLDRLESDIARLETELANLKDNKERDEKQKQLDEKQTKRNARLSDKGKRKDDDVEPCLALLDALAGKPLTISKWQLKWEVQSELSSKTIVPADIPGGLGVVGAIGSISDQSVITLEPQEK